MTSNSDFFPVCLRRANNTAICPFASHLIFLYKTLSQLSPIPFVEQGELSSRLGPDGHREWDSDWPKHRPFTFRFLQNRSVSLPPSSSSAPFPKAAAEASSLASIEAAADHHAVLPFSHSHYPDSCSWASMIFLAVLTPNAVPYRKGQRIPAYYRSIAHRMPVNVPLQSATLQIPTSSISPPPRGRLHKPSTPWSLSSLPYTDDRRLLREVSSARLNPGLASSVFFFLNICNSEPFVRPHPSSSALVPSLCAGMLFPLLCAFLSPCLFVATTSDSFPVHTSSYPPTRVPRFPSQSRLDSPIIIQFLSNVHDPLMLSSGYSSNFSGFFPSDSQTGYIKCPSYLRELQRSPHPITARYSIADILLRSQETITTPTCAPAITVSMQNHDHVSRAGDHHASTRSRDKEVLQFHSGDLMSTLDVIRSIKNLDSINTPHIVITPQSQKIAPSSHDLGNHVQDVGERYDTSQGKVDFVDSSPSTARRIFPGLGRGYYGHSIELDSPPLDTRDTIRMLPYLAAENVCLHFNHTQSTWD
ncbi:uncharacterized protein CLUP02_03188 [Colletotrichum lupini]|uniref:Uncharacterized protein n=1 Tax=Colletotrichum lupini TaxID=145971 RepID=A0A9Q8SJN0_9PEZI|nr:uncharacterized protein CLUP02_03188 [Colletotrichum lupini]UQC77717.1 hypothetical protein CLUP02_03188 [Colletotrichum lupini]